MKKYLKLFTVLAVLIIAAFLCFACFSGCRQGGTQSTAHVHVYDDIYDATCNTCGYTRVPANRPSTDTDDKTDGDDNPEVDGKPDESENPDTGDTDYDFVLDADTDGLILEGLAEEYRLNEQTPSFDFTAVELEVFLSCDGKKGKAVPEEYYTVIVTYGGKLPGDLKNLTADGAYKVTVALKNIGRKIRAFAADCVYLQTGFEVVNPVTAIRLKSGNTTQYESKTDKMSSDWVFEGVRANGDNFDIPRGEVKIPILVTDSKGTRTVTAEYSGLFTQIEYTVVPQPQVVNRVDILYDNSEKFVDEGEVFTVGLGDITVYVNAESNSKYEGSYVFVYGGTECESVDLPARDKPHALKLKATFTYTVENETFTKILVKELQFKVTVRPTEPENTNLVADGAVIGGLGEAVTKPAVLAESVNGAIGLIPSDNVNISAGGCAEVEIDGKTFDSALTVAGKDDDFQSAKVITFSLKEAAVVKFYFSADVFAMVNMEDADGNIYNSEDYYPGNGKGVLTFKVEKGEYTLAVLGNVNIYCIEAVFE